jgi:hypothetical protein
MGPELKADLKVRLYDRRLTINVRRGTTRRMY